MAKLLKDKRGETGLPLSEVARITRIKESYLRAIEEEDFEKLPIEVYTRGYIREYAKFLGVPAEEGLDLYERHLDAGRSSGEGSQTKPVPETARPGPLVSPDSRDRALPSAKDGSPGATSKPSFMRLLTHRRIAWALPAALAVLIIYSAFPHKKEVTGPTLKLEEPVQVKANQPAQGVPETAVVPATGSQLPQALQTGEPVASQPTDKPNRLDIVATDRVWLQVVVDGTEKRDMLLNPGDRVSYRASQNFALKIGNAGGLRLVFNERQFDNLGSKGQVIRLSFPDDGSDPSSPQRNNLGNRILPSSEASQP